MSRNRDQRGFTLIELLLAMTMFSFVIIFAAAAFIQLNRAYHRSRTATRVQETARAVIEDIERNIRYAAKDERILTGTSGSLQINCIGRFAYIQDMASTTDNLIKRPYDGSVSCDNAGTLPSGEDENMVQDGLRVNTLTVSAIGAAASARSYRITVIVSAGSGTDIITNETGATPQCLQGNQSGSQFCAVARLETVTSRRMVQ